MRTKLRRFLSTLLLLLSLSVSLIVWGCRGGDGTGGRGGAGAPGGPGSPGTTPPSALAAATILAATGGTVTVPSAHPLAGTSIVIPAGALADDTVISINAAPTPAMPGAVGPAIDIGPNGTVFRIPATVMLVYNRANLPAGTVEARMFIVKVEETGVLTPLSGGMVDVANSQVRGNTSALSVFAIVSSANRPPVANAGPAQTAAVGTTVQLNGAGSSDADGDALQFRWTFTTVPAGSSARLSDAALVNPTFVIDRPGTYTVQLVVNDGLVDSAPATVTISTRNSAPVANAGPAQTAAVGTTVQLNGAGSSDADGDLLQFRWAFTTLPTGSTATLSDPTAVQPTFVVDSPGTYVVQLIVNDGQASSLPATVTITTSNSAPVANAGPAQSVVVGTLVRLDGSRSSDVDGDRLGFQWAFTSAPAGSLAMLSDSAAVAPTFIVDRPGTYVVQLIVSDGRLLSAPSTVTIDTDNSAPVANAGPDQTVAVGTTVQLNGAGSSDADGDALQVRWAFTAVPMGSSARLSDAMLVNPTFVVDRPGTYTVQLIVNDGTADSVPATVTISTRNSAPVANASAAQSVVAGTTVQLDGRASSDVDGDPLIFQWALTTVPAGSLATLTNATTATPTFVADLPGLYVVQLIVNDGLVDSVPHTVTITAHTTANLRLNIIELSVSMRVDMPNPITIQLEDAGVAIPAPPGIVVTLTASNLGCVAPASVPFPTGMLTVAPMLQHGGTTVLPCSTTVTASAPGIASDSVDVTFMPLPSLRIECSHTSDASRLSPVVGAGLQQVCEVTGGIRRSPRIDLRGYNHEVHLESHDATKVLFAPTDRFESVATAGGTATLTIPPNIPFSTRHAPFFLQGVETAGPLPAAAVIRASAPGFTSAIAVVTVVQPQLALMHLPATTTSASPSIRFTAVTGIPFDPRTPPFFTTFLGQKVRTGGTPKSVTITLSTPTVAQLATSAGTGPTVTILVPEGEFSVGVEFDPLAAGSTIVHATMPGFIGAIPHIITIAP